MAPNKPDVLQVVLVKIVTKILFWQCAKCALTEASSWLKKLENGKNWGIWYNTGHLKVLLVHNILPHPATAGEIM